MNLKIGPKPSAGLRRRSQNATQPAQKLMTPIIFVKAPNKKSAFIKPALAMLAMAPLGGISASKDRKHHGSLI